VISGTLVAEWGRHRAVYGEARIGKGETVAALAAHIAEADSACA
jgi:hypothetical protein